MQFPRLDSSRSKVLQNSFLDTFQNAEVLHDFQVLCLVQVQLVGVLAGLQWVDHCGGIGHSHLLGHLVGSCQQLAFSNLFMIFEQYIPLSLPRMNPKTDCKPIKLRKYQERLETHCTSRSRVMTPDCSMDLKRIVRGKGNFTAKRVSPSLTQRRNVTYRSQIRRRRH